jgi:cytochrome b
MDKNAMKAELWETLFFTLLEWQILENVPQMWYNHTEGTDKHFK